MELHRLEQSQGLERWSGVEGIEKQQSSVIIEAAKAPPAVAREQSASLLVRERPNHMSTIIRSTYYVKRPILEESFSEVRWTVAEGIDHKSEAGGVKTHLAHSAELEAAYRELTGRLGEQTEGVIALGKYRWQSHCRGLYQLPMAA